MRTLRERAQDQDGAIAIMGAVLATALVLASALAVDVGRVAYVSRDQQGATDRGALDSVLILRANGNEASPETLAAVHEEAIKALERNPETGTQRDRLLYRVDLGRAEDPAATTFELVCGGYFRDGQPVDRSALVGEVLNAPDPTSDDAADQPAPPACDGGVAGAHVDAVRLWTYGAVDYVLAIGASGTSLHKVSSARSTPPSTTCPDDDPDCDPPPPPCPDDDPDCDDQLVGRGTISVGSTLASMETSVLDDLLSGWVRTSVSADLVGYQGVAAGQVRLGDLVASDHLSAGTVDELLHADVSVFDLIRATAEVLSAEGGTSAAIATELEGLLAGEVAGELGPIRLGHTAEDVGGIDLTSGEGAGADVRVDAVEMVLAALQIANQSHGVALDLSVFGEALPVTLTVIEPPVIAEGLPGTDENGAWRTVAETAQVRLDLAVDLQELIGANAELQSLLEPVLEELLEVVGELLGIVTDVTCIVGIGCGADDVELTLQEINVVVRAAEGESALTDVQCDADGALSTETTVRSARVWVEGDVFEVEDEVLAIDEWAQLTAGESAPEGTDFDGPFPTGPVRVPEGGSPLNASLSAGDLVGTGDLSDVDELVGPVTDLLGLSLVGEEGIITDVLDQLGLSLSSADVLAHDVDCTQRSLQPSVDGS